ncbi:MAG TPA: hypothetical protein PLH27_14570 [bacterium]|nr:hypothetical protein [bacterium]HMW32434.1 hypothetical protein [bacterium]HMW34729.1 hypothetical protein [bacterium]HMY37110.1 hypothetical protein [bacterium]HMZ03088.1 hypothetical protein [bacterium]
MKTHTQLTTETKPKKDYLFVSLMALIGLSILAFILRLAGLI